MRSLVHTEDGPISVVAGDNGDIYLGFRPTDRFRLTPIEAQTLARVLRVYGELKELEA